MSILQICLGYAGRSTEFQDDSSYLAAYKSVYKPLGAALLANPQIKFSFFFTGTQLEVFKKKNPEFLELIKNLAARKQVEVIGGGYYNPLFPLLLPADRAMQIEKLTMSLRQHFGKRPRGIHLFCDSWDPSLISTFAATNLEYAILDRSLFHQIKSSFFPVAMSNLGKSIVILPLESGLAAKKGESAKSYFSRIHSAYKEAVQSDGQNPDAARTVSLFFDKDTIAPFLAAQWRDDFCAALQGSGDCAFALPANCVKEAEVFEQAFVHSGINQKIARWCSAPYESVDTSSLYPVSVYDYLQTYKASRALFDRMMNVSMMASQCHGDKMRKNAARERLLAAQSGEAYVCRSSNELASFAERQSAYKNLMEAERLVRECSAFKESVTSYDYNGDGINEYICRLEKCNVCVGSSGGSIFELDVPKAGGNYADNISRSKKYDGLDDNYFRGIFVDHLFEDDEAKKYCKGEPCRNGMFSAKRYREVSFSSQRHEIHLETKTKFSTLDQPISLKKNYTVKSNGITVQYILKNEGPIAVQGKFAVESNLAELALLNPNYKPYSIEIVSGQSIVKGTSAAGCKETVPGGLVTGASAVQITDENSNVSFVFTPNEEAGVTFFPVTFKRRNMDTDILQNESRTFVSAFVWNVDLPAGMEVEKTINLTISQTKKRKK